MELGLVSLAFFIIFISTLTLTLALQRRSRKSLPPGPVGLPVIGHLHLLGPRIHQTFSDMASRHGPLFHIRLGSVPVVVASTPELARELLKTHDAKFASRGLNKAIDTLTYRSSFSFAPSGPYWTYVKKLCMWELLGARTMANFLPARAQEYRLFLRALAGKSAKGEPVNLTDELMKLTNNVISRVMFGSRSGSGSESREAIRAVTELFGEFNVSDFIWFLKNVDFTGSGKRIEETHTRYDALLEKIIKDRERVRATRMSDSNDNVDEDERVKDFLDMLLDVAEDPNAEVRITRVHIKALFLDFFTAATDTTAIATEWALAELLNNPTLLQKAREEIDQVVGKTRLVCESDGPNLPYIQAIMKETLRLHPPVPMINRKSTEECRVGDYVIPPNTLLFVNVWAIGRDPKNWKDPLQFKPERFGENGNNIDVKGRHFELLPFGSGRRGCPGMSLALQELPVILGALIQCFDWKMAGLDGLPMKGDDVVVDMSERPGLTAPRATDMICFPIPRFDLLGIIDEA